MSPFKNPNRQVDGAQAKALGSARGKEDNK